MLGDSPSLGVLMPCPRGAPGIAETHARDRGLGGTLRHAAHAPGDLLVLSIIGGRP